MHLDDLSGNPFQPDLLFRGFTASPVEGETEGLAVYVNGARFNTPFGDTVNWDLIPPNAIAQVNVEGSSPLFGLNALGGSVVVKLKDGFDYQGGEFVAYGGSYGRAGALFQTAPNRRTPRPTSRSRRCTTTTSTTPPVPSCASSTATSAGATTRARST